MFKTSSGKNPKATRKYSGVFDDQDDQDDDQDEDETDDNATDEEGNVWVPVPANLYKKKSIDDDDDEAEESLSEEEFADDDEDAADEAEPEAENEADLLVLDQNDKDRTQLPEGKALATVTNVAASHVASKYDNGTYVRVELTLAVENRETRENFAKKFYAAKGSGRLFDLVSGILGEEPDEGFNLKSLLKKKTIVVVEHRENSKGELWDEIVSAKPYSKSSIKKNYR